MSITKEDLLQLANDLLLNSAEVHHRSAVSRAYYAAYHGCLGWHANMPVPGSVDGPPGGVHQQLFNQLRNGAPGWSISQKSLGRVLSMQLGGLKIRRTTADYHLGKPFDEATAATNCATAGTLLSKL